MVVILFPFTRAKFNSVKEVIDAMIKGAEEIRTRLFPPATI